jgi:hypothetical protein
MEYKSVIKKNEIMSFSGKWIELKIIILNEISQPQKDKYHIFTHIENLNLKVYNNNMIAK